MEDNTLRYKKSNEISLTDNEKLSLFNLVSSGCRQPKKEKLYNIIVKWGMINGNYGIYERVTFENGIAHYCAGQSYPDEIRVLRDCLLGK